MRWRLRLSKIDIDIQYKKGIKNCQVDASSRPRTNSEEVVSTAKLAIPKIDTPDVSECDFIHTKSDADDNLFVALAATNMESMYEPVDSTTLVQEQLQYSQTRCKHHLVRVLRRTAHNLFLEGLSKLKRRWPISRINWLPWQMNLFPSWWSVLVPSEYYARTTPSRNFPVIALRKQRTHVQILFGKLYALLTIDLVFWIYQFVATVALSLHKALL